MKLLDRYILKHFLQNFLFGIFCFVLIFILIDLFEKLDKFIDKGLSFGIILQYYIYFIPEILKLILPVGMLLASLFTVSRFVTYSELVAMKSAGISIYRYLMPILIFGAIITCFSIYFNGWVVPLTNSKKISMEREYLDKHQTTPNIQHIYFQDRVNRIISIDSYDKQSQRCDNVSIQIFSNDSLTHMLMRFDAAHMVWDSAKNDWMLTNYFKRNFLSLESEELKIINSKYLSEIEEIQKINLDPDLIIKKQLKPEELVLSDFKEFITNLEDSGQDVARAKVDYYSIISFPFANLVTIIFGVSVSSNRRKGGAALQFGISILVSFIYLGFVKISQVFGYNGEIPPILTAWLANILFLLISLVNFYRLNRL
ncbi:MAG: LptF/LptG family permease [Ignavibacteria bacterium]|nr:LptF/LptG family permease [Ignavibacteria bacterium]